MTNAIFKSRRAAHLENDFLRVTVLEEGGHIAEVLDKRAGASPLWIPHWTSLEPPTSHPTNTATSEQAPMPSSWQASWATICASTCLEGPRPKKLSRASPFTAKPRWIATASRNLPANCFSA